MIRALLILAALAASSAAAVADEQWLVVDKADGNCFPLASAFPDDASPAAYRDALERQGALVKLHLSDDQKFAVLVNATYRSETYLAQGDAACRRALAALSSLR